MIERCSLCGGPVRVHHGAEGTSAIVAAGEPGRRRCVVTISGADASLAVSVAETLLAVAERTWPQLGPVMAVEWAEDQEDAE